MVSADEKVEVLAEKALDALGEILSQRANQPLRLKAATDILNVWARMPKRAQTAVLSDAQVDAQIVLTLRSNSERVARLLAAANLIRKGEDQ